MANPERTDDRRWPVLRRVRAQWTAARRLELARAAAARTADCARAAARSIARLPGAHTCLVDGDRAADLARDHEPAGDPPSAGHVGRCAEPARVRAGRSAGVGVRSE